MRKKAFCSFLQLWKNALNMQSDTTGRYGMNIRHPLPKLIGQKRGLKSSKFNHKKYPGKALRSLTRYLPRKPEYKCALKRRRKILHSFIDQKSCVCHPLWDARIHYFVPVKNTLATPSLSLSWEWMRWFTQKNLPFSRSFGLGIANLISWMNGTRAYRD